MLSDGDIVPSSARETIEKVEVALRTGGREARDVDRDLP